MGARLIKFLVLFPLLALGACFKSEPPSAPVDIADGSLLVLNEGNFQWGNASVNRFDLQNGTYNETDLFASVNGRPLGDVLQSGLVVDDEIWLVVNNSGRIEVVDKSSFTLKRSLTGFNSPRYVCPLDTGRMLVSDLYEDSLSLIHPKDGQLIQKIAFKGWSEQMLLHEDKVWISNPNTYKVYALDADSLYLSDSIEIGFASYVLQKDQEDRIWISTKGDKILGIQSQIHCLDPKTKTLIHSYDIGEEAILDMCIHQDHGYFIYENKLYRFPLQNPQNQEVIYDKGGSLYAVETYNGQLFLCDAVDYVQKGKVIVLDPDGHELQSFRAGRIPNGFLFIP